MAEELFWVMSPIRYKNPDHELFRKRVEPGVALPFPHLSDEEKALLQRRRVLAPLTAKEARDHEKQIRALAKEKAAAEAAAKKAAVEELERQKKQAMEKQAEAKAEEVTDAQDS